MSKPVKSKTLINHLEQLGYKFRMNVTTDKVEVEHNGELLPLTDALAAKIRVDMRDKGFGSVNVMQDAYIAEALKNQYHPVREYLESLPAWNGEPVIEQLSSYFVDRYDVFCIFLRRWLIGCIAKALKQEQNFMLVLDGPQGLGKSYFARWICPPVLRSKMFMEGGVKTDDKDTWLRLCDRFIWEVAELGATTRKADREALKDFISRREVTIRQPYGRYEATRPALANLIGTINSEGIGFLNDPTGNRRFAVTEIQTIDRAYSEEIDVDSLWAQAYALSLSGESHRLNEKEIGRQAAINEEYQVTSVVEEMFWSVYEIDPDDNAWTSVAEIVSELELQGLKGQQHRTIMELASIFKREGVEKKRMGSTRATAYRGVIRKPLSQINSGA